MVTCKSATPSRITDNTQIFDFTLNDSQMEQLNALECGFRVTPSTVKDIAVRGRYYKDMPWDGGSRLAWNLESVRLSIISNPILQWRLSWLRKEKEDRLVENSRVRRKYGMKHGASPPRIIPVRPRI